MQVSSGGLTGSGPRPEPPAAAGGGCEATLSSVYSELFGLPLSLFGAHSFGAESRSAAHPAGRRVPRLGRSADCSRCGSVYDPPAEPPLSLSNPLC